MDSGLFCAMYTAQLMITLNFFVDVIHQIESLPNDNRIIGGDFNLVLNLDIDKNAGIQLPTQIPRHW